MLSFWESQSFLTYDYIIVGSGIVGLSTACSLLERSPTARVLVLERGILPTGASTRNAGFACIGSLTELLADLAHTPPADVCALVVLRWQGLRQLRHRLGDQALDYQANGSYELLTSEQLSALDHLSSVNALLRPVLGADAFGMANDRIAAFGFDGQRVAAMVANHLEGQLDTGKMMYHLWQHATRLGAMVLTGALVAAIHDHPSQGAQVQVWHPVLQHEVVFTAHSSAIVCTNAFAKTLLPTADIQPGRGQVLVTHPIERLPFKGIFHYDEGYFYFRNYGNRVILGGGRNLDFATETTTDIALNSSIQASLQHHLRTFILPHTPFSIDTAWAGIMAFGSHTKTPLIQRISPHLVAGVRLGGMGVAIGSALGKQLADMC